MIFLHEIFDDRWGGDGRNRHDSTGSTESTPIFRPDTKLLTQGFTPDTLGRLSVMWRKATVLASVSDNSPSIMLIARVRLQNGTLKIVPH